MNTERCGGYELGMRSASGKAAPYGMVSVNLEYESPGSWDQKPSNVAEFCDTFGELLDPTSAAAGRSGYAMPMPLEILGRRTGVSRVPD